MPLREELEQQGNWFFRWRSYLPLVLVPLLLAAMVLDPGSISRYPWWPALCIAISFLGEAFRFYAVGHVPKGTSGRNTVGQIANSLNTTGIYSTVRHPLYLGNLIIWLGVSMLSGNAWVTLVTVLAFGLYYERIMLAEEEFLRRKFGVEYEAWAERTPAFVPRLARWQRPELPFSWRTAFRREYSGIFGIVAMFTFLELVRSELVHGRLRLGWPWMAFFFSGLFVYLLLIALKKKTRLLHVEGR